MRVHFWGTRGSLPASISSEAIRKKIVTVVKAARTLKDYSDEEIEEFLQSSLLKGNLPFSAMGTYGSNTSCIEIVGGNEFVLCDAGTGIRDFGNHILNTASQQKDDSPKVFNILMSHLHWDHIQGFPFFTPAYKAGNRINIFGFHEELEKAFVHQQEYPFFPVPMKAMAAQITFTLLEPEKEYEIAGLTIKTKMQNHPGASYGYRFEKDGKSIVYSTDSEHKSEAYNDDYSFLDFLRDADLLIIDAQYPLFEAISTKENWGHSSNIMAVELSARANAKRLCIFHNEPSFSDEMLDEFLENTRKYLRIYSALPTLQIDLAYDGLQIEV
ncbi:MAG: MBL fold hydrolase [Syntrophus sp. (in: bacteria)]|nr:MBL fold hydrolase [Syntrophus sp. (in: bacteria)]